MRNTNMKLPIPGEEALFQAAVQLPGPERAAFLDRECAGDPALRTRLNALLAAHDAPDGVLASYAEANRPTITLELLDLPDPAVGLTIGRYKLLERLGEGGCGVVYVAEQTEPVRRRVALKVIKLGMDTREVIARFEAERQALALMDHPNIAKVLDAGTTEAGKSEIRDQRSAIPTGRPYFVMELVRGIRITDYCDRHNLTIQERLDLLIKVCQAIQHAHQKGIIHRDIKPSNILVTLHDGVPVPKVIDFGIAKATEGRLTNATVYTQLHQFIGTPAYMSPEQAEMSGLDIDTRSDIYSLGVLLYELLTGATPFDAKELIASGIDAMRKTIREQEPMRPSTRLAMLSGKEQTTTAKRRGADVPRIIHQLKGDLDWIVMKSLEKDRTRRYETANGVAADIKRCLNNEPVVARPPSAVYRLHKAWRRNRLAFAATTSIAVALFVSAGVSTDQARRAVRAQAEEHRQRTRAEDNERRAIASEEAARRGERETRQRLYAADMVATQQALREGNLGLARAYLRGHIPAQGEPDLRGFEWRYFGEQSEGDQLHTFTGHSNVAYCVSFSPNGRWLASGGWDEKLFLWDVAGRSLLGELKPGGGEIRSIAFSADNRLMAVGAQRDVSVWRMDDARRPALMKRREAREARVIFLPNTFHVIIGQNVSVWGYSFEPSLVEIWDFEEGKTVRTFEDVGARIALSADGTVLFTGVRNRLIHRWDLNGGPSSTKASFDWPLRSLGCSPDGKWLVTTSGEEENAAQLWDGSTLKPIRTLMRHQDKNDIWNVAFSPDNQRVATTHADQLIRVWTLASPSPPLTLRGHGGEVRAACFSPDGNLLATAGADEKVCLWDLGAASQPTAITNVDHDQWRQGPALSSDGKLLAIGGVGATVEIWDLDSIERLQVLTNTSHVLRFSDDDSKLLTLDENVTIKVWDLPTRTLETVAVLTNRVGHFRPVALSPDGTLLVAGSRESDDSSTITIWNVNTGESRQRLRAHHRALWAIFFFPEGETFVTCGEDRATRIWNTSTLELEAEFAGHKDQVFGVALSADGALMATASIDATIKVWDVPARKELLTFKGHRRGVLDVVFNADGKTIASCSDDGSVRFWSLATGREVGGWQGLHQACWAVFSPDGSRLVTVDNTGTARVLNGRYSTLPAHSTD
jgi:eukaryotic-like serine/threonine-protein kinase